MKIRSFLTSNLCAISVMAAMSSQAAVSPFQSGFYAAGKGGTEEIRGKMEVHTTLDVFELDLIDGTTDHVVDDVPMYKNYGVGNLALGYNLVMGSVADSFDFLNSFDFLDRFMIGVEVSGNISGTEEVSLHDLETSTIDLPPFDDFPLSITSFEAEYEAGFTNPDLNTDLRLGFLLMPNFMLYGRVGAAFNEVRQTIDSTYTVIDVLGFTDHVETHVEHEEDIVGLRVGIGAEYKLSDWFGMTMDYIYTAYGDVDMHEVATDSLGVLVDTDFTMMPASVTTDMETELSKQTIMLGAVVYFGGKKQQQPAPIYIERDK